MKEKCETTTKERQGKAERGKANRSYSERVRAKWFFCAFKLGFPQLIWKASWFFKPNLDLEKFTITLLKKLFQTVLNWKSSMKTQPWSAKFHYNLFYVSWNKKTFLMKLNMISCILLVLLLLVSMVLIKCTNSPLVIHFLNFVRWFRL